jgi:hypothetical protein
VRTLPDSPDLRRLRSEAKQILRAHAEGDRSVSPTLRRLRKLEGASDEQVLATSLRLTEVQFALALDYGFESWRALCERARGAAEENAESRRLLDEVRDALLRKGPSTDHMHSDYHRDLIGTINGLLQGGRPGIRAAVELARSPERKLRRAAPFMLCVSGDPAALAEMLQLLKDPSHDVRLAAVRWFAAAIHPNQRHDVRTAEQAAEAVPAEVRHLLPLLDDPHVKVRWYFVRSLHAYARLGDPMVDAALHQALGDGAHKVVHEAARALRITCPGCGSAPRPAPPPELR